MKRLYLCLFCLSMLASHASESSGWRLLSPQGSEAQFAGNEVIESIDEVLLASSNAAPSASPTSMQASADADSPADIITPEIQNLADSLNKDPALIFKFVYNTIAYEHYFGCKKGAHLTLLEGAGNDMDQAALLVALLKAAGHSSKYFERLDLIPYDSTVSPYAAYPTDKVMSGVSWLGLGADPYPGLAISQATKDANGVSNWSDADFKKMLCLYNYFGTNKIPNGFHPQKPGCIYARRMVVKMETAEGGNLVLDPSAKHQFVNDKIPLDLISATRFDAAEQNEFLDVIGGTSPDINFVSGLQENVIKEKIAQYTTSLVSKIRETRPTDSVEDILGTIKIRPLDFNSSWESPSIMEFMEGAPEVGGPKEHDTMPENYLATIEFEISGTTASRKTAELQGRRVIVTSEGNIAQVWLDDVKILEQGFASTGYTMRTAISHPGMPTQETNDVYKQGRRYALVCGFSSSKRFLDSRKKHLEDYLAQTRKAYPSIIASDGSFSLNDIPDPVLQRKLVGESLNVLGHNWIYQINMIDRVIARLVGGNTVTMHRIGRIGQEEGFYTDISLASISYFPENGLTVSPVTGLRDNRDLFYLLTTGLMGSALEHGVIDQQNAASDTAISTVQIFHLANDDAAANGIYRTTSANWASIKPQLSGYGSDELAVIETEILLFGSVVYLPRQAVTKPGWSWSGAGYVGLIPLANGYSASMRISGGYNGGWNVTDSTINPSSSMGRDTMAPNYHESGDFSYYGKSTAPAGNVIPTKGADPIDMATGAYIYSKEDLSLGQAGVRGLSFQRNYNSNRHSANDAKLGFGWTHNYDMRAVVRTAPDAGLGETTPLEMAPMLAATTVVYKLIEKSSAAKSMTAAALVAKVAMDNLLNNAVSIALGKESVQFIKQPDGTYMPPAGSTLSLDVTGSSVFLKERFGNTFTFDLENGGRGTGITDPFGKTLALAYGGNGLEQVTDAYGRTLAFSYENGLIKTVADGTGRVVQYGYDNDQNLVSAQDPENATDTFTYDGEHRILQARDAAGRVIITNHYNVIGQVHEQDSEGSPDKRWKLSFSGPRSTETDPLGNTTVYFYDERGRPVAIQDGEGNTARLEYDAHDRLVAQTSPKGETTTFKYDASHNLTETVNPIGTRTQFSYDGLLRLTQTTVEAAGEPSRTTRLEYNTGNETNLPNRVYDARDHAAHFWYNTDGTVQKVHDHEGRETSFSYINGLPASVVLPGNHTVGFSYNARGDLLSRTDANGKTTTYAYDKNRRQLQATFPAVGGVSATVKQTYDPSGNLATVEDPAGTLSRFTYSATGNLLTETVAAGTAEQATVTRQYGLNDQPTVTIDPLGNQVAYAHDRAGRLTALTDPLGHTHQVTYDANDNTATSQTPLGHISTFSHDARNALTAVEDPLGGTVGYTYNGFGERTGIKNRLNKEYAFSHDANGNLTQATTPSGKVTTATYDERDLVETVLKSSGNGTTFVYDALGRLASQSDPAGSIAFTYDNNGNPLTVTEGTAVLTRSYDALNRPASYTNAAGETISYHYNPNGLLEQIVYPGNRAVNYTYTRLNQLKTVTDWAGRVTTYEWDLLGRNTRIVRPNGTTRENRYDAAGRLISYQERTGPGDLIAYAGFGYDADNRLVSRYRLPGPVSSAPAPAISASYDADNRLTSFNGVAVTHDDDGNMTSGPLAGTSAVAYTYDARNRLTGVGGTSFGYDAENNRIAQTDGSGTTHYLVDPHGDALPRVLVRTAPGGAKTYYVYGIGLAYEISEDGTPANEPRYYHFDHLGSTVALTDGTGAVTDRVEYGVYGETIYRTGTTPTPFLYVGQFGVQTDGTGLHYMRARYYNAQLMRFINVDPIGFAGGMNWYAYANNSPLLFIDPSGFCGESGGANWLGTIGNRAKLSFGPAFDIVNNIGAGLGWAGTKFIQAVRSPLDGNRFWETGGEYWTEARDPFGKAGWYDINDVPPMVGKDVVELVVYAAGTNVGALRGGTVSTSRAGVQAGVAAENQLANVSNLAKPLGRGSTGRTAVANLKEQLAMKQVMSNPAAGSKVQLTKGMTDARWPASDGWVKMRQNINGVEVHYVRNMRTGAVDDFKLKN